MVKNSFINMRINEKTKKDVEDILSDLGLTLSGSIELFLSQVILTKKIPFEIKLPEQEQIERRQKIVESVSNISNVSINKNIRKIINLYVYEEISYDVALYAIKKELEND